MEITNNLYKKHGCTELGIGRGACKKHLEEANCSYEKAEEQLVALKTIRTSDLDEIVRYGSLVANLEAETCKKIYMQANYNKEQAIQLISANNNSVTEQTDKKTNSHKIKKWVILLLFAIIGFGGYLVYASLQNQEYVTARVYKDANGQNYTYTGYISQNGPDGKGTGVYSYGTYTGEYKNGLRHGNGEFKSTDGSNKYKGTFSNDKYDTGILTVADGYYFDGNFKDGQPYNGSWYDKTGRFDRKFVNG